MKKIALAALLCFTTSTPAKQLSMEAIGTATNISVLSMSCISQIKDLDSKTKDRLLIGGAKSTKMISDSIGISLETTLKLIKESSQSKEVTKENCEKVSKILVKSGLAE